MKAAKNKDGARRFLDWTLSDRAVEAYYDRYEIITVGGGSMPEAYLEAGMPAEIEPVLFPMDYAWSAQNRERILQKWQSEFER